MSWYKIINPGKYDIKLFRKSIWHDSFHTFDEVYVDAVSQDVAVETWLKNEGLEADPFNFDVAPFEPGEGFVDVSNKNMILLFKDGELVYTWNNDAQVDYPEDLSWDRMIRDVFMSGYKLGKQENSDERS
jgi:hypothetical protein